jgi:hypothetical protein
MTDRPIIFSPTMVLALLAGRKTQTRRLAKLIEPTSKILEFIKVGSDTKSGRSIYEMKNAMGQHVSIREAKHFMTPQYMPPIAVGDRLWVRENHAVVPRTAYRMSEGVQQTLRPEDNHDAAVYQAGWERSKPGRWRPSIHMPRWASRLTLTVKDVKIERLKNISRDDAIAEGLIKVQLASPLAIEMGCDWGFEGDSRHGSPVSAYSALWNHINGDGAWDENPWVAAVTFEVIKDNIDRVAA